MRGAGVGEIDFLDLNRGDVDAPLPFSGGTDPAGIFVAPGFTLLPWSQRILALPVAGRAEAVVRDPPDRVARLAHRHSLHHATPPAALIHHDRLAGVRVAPRGRAGPGRCNVRN